MGNLVKGLASINAYVEAEEEKYQARQNKSDRPKAVWFKIEDKESVKVRFLQELDEDSPNYNEKNGIGFLAIEHSNPGNWHRKALCTMDEEGRCYACEMHNKDWKAGWKSKTRLYVNVLVDNGKDEPFVAVLSQGNGPKSITPSLIEQASEIGTITDKLFKVKRSGKGISDTSYILTPLTEASGNVEDYELFNLEDLLYDVEYAKQSAHYHNGEKVEEPVAEEVAGTSDPDW